MKSKVDYSLYLVTDQGQLKGLSLTAAIEQAIQGGVTAVQLREKSSSSREFYQLAVQLKTITAKYRVPLIINDRLDIMLAAEADGLHVGEDDLPVEVVRALIGPEKILGFSAGTVAEAQRGEKAGADYLGVGAVFATGSKSDAGEPIGLGQLAAIKQSVKIPIVGIGGINEKNAGEVRKAGANGIAVISAIIGKSDPREASRQVLSAWQAAKPD